MTTDLDRYRPMGEVAVDNAPPPLDVSYWGNVLVFAAQVADAVSDTEFVPGALRGRREAVAATILYGAEVGLTPMQALAGIHIVDGKPQPSAELARGLILRAGHTFHVVEMTGTRARVWGQRKGRPDSERVVVEWTIDMARSAGLLGRPPWQRYPRAMLVARATGDLARILFPDVVKGLGYVAEDEPDALEAWAPSGPEVEAPQAPRRAIQRRRRPAPGTPVQTAVLPAEGALNGDSDEVAPVPHVSGILDELADAQQAHDENRDAGRWLTDEEALATAPSADEARAAIEAELASEEPPSAPAPTRVSLDDEPLPDEYVPVGTGRPVPRGAPVPTSPDNERAPLRVMPDPEPEAPADEVAPPGLKTLGERPFTAMQAGISRELGTAATRDERLALVAAIVGHPVDTTKTLPREDGYRVLDYLDRFSDGDAWWEFVDGGERIVVHDGPRPVEG